MDQTSDKHIEKAERQIQKVVKYYANDYPKQGQLVMVQCITYEENGCYVELLQYERKKAMIPFNQYTTSMKKNIHRAMKVGRVQVARVTKVDTNKGYIDLSKSKVSPQDQNLGQQKFAKSKALHSIIINISPDTKTVQNIYKNIIWPMYVKYPNNHPHDLLKQILVYLEFLCRKQDKAEEYGITEEKLKTDLIHQLRRRYKKTVIKSIAIFKVSIKSFDGILKIKKILQVGAEAAKQKNFDVKITILGAPDYLCEISSSTKEEGEEGIMLALDTIKDEAAKVKGQFKIEQKPKVVGDTNHAIHQIYVQQMDNQDDVDNDEAQLQN